ncbi:heat shock transcription factor, putative [Entamoeba histolytica HM-1:IMSS-B]|uniref:Heat shock transcription factor, putative n=6 Tax=Entamoeba histolytica TaxID=5759 RepID=C4M0N0_ENTH1|nr:heat shock transcription factor, putative [Entamoeba histolytica HM-1:IMSS]EMD42747.1 heat shock transcription factor, putative [Entamoeba histolytica KU27]EMH74194.1 heat shock transcription factor, putative [Entamoeba histolytica HM-1:IMSS-B]EMS11287.1 heat shock transcription factor, putative [Entamoeba histolytica HM-3:IMSS]ENY64529.1 heat shock transcription factor, putative [Entamoeba histolytica HM-1:IMSS-A]GAT94726.1 heat shock transcription factor putative [Entamoeba histolytica]|eukprot:XP_652549.1 heat shock transcription factor, putative [Entamoeba histolytica HM-1:IMSS]
METATEANNDFDCDLPLPLDGTEPNSQRGNSVVSFVSILYSMVDSKENAQYIRWCEKDQGHSFEILDAVAFSKEVLPKYYKHTNFCGFSRQLSLYGFKKFDNEYRFQNSNFIKGHMELLKNVQRKKPQSQRKKQNNTTLLYQQLLSQLMQLQKQNLETVTQINTLKEMLYQLKLREDSLELKMQRLQDTFMPNPSSLAFGFNLMPMPSPNDTPTYPPFPSQNNNQGMNEDATPGANETNVGNHESPNPSPNFVHWGDSSQQTSQLPWKF